MDDRVRVPDLGSKWDEENQKHVDYVSRAYTDLLRVARAAKVVHDAAKYDLKHERPGYYVHSDSLAVLTKALKEVEHLL
jgi:hypothetical protein